MPTNADKPTVAVFAHDPGGARAVLKVVQRLQANGSCSLHVFTAGPASALYADAGLAPAPLAEEAGALLARLRPDGLLVGSSIASPADRALVRAARTLGIPSMAVVDYWDRYALRFSDLARPGALDCLPDRVTSIDPQMTAGLVAAGVPADRIVETGQPAFDGLPGVASPEGQALRARGRAAWGVGAGERVLLFASQPESAFCGTGPDNPNWRGFSEVTVLDLVLEVLRERAERGAETVVLMLRPHPREDRASFERRVADGGRLAVRLDPLRAPHESVLAADVVTGLSSILLMEAALMGRLALSLQPGLLGEDSLKSNARGLTFPAYTRPEAAALVARALDAPGAMESQLHETLRSMRPDGRAAERIAAALIEMVRPPR